MKSNLEDAFDKVDKKKKPAPGKPRKRQPPPRVAAIIGVGLGLVIALNLGIYLHRILVEDAELDNLQKASRAHVAKVAEDIRTYLDGVERTLSLYASKPTLLASMVMEDTTRVEKVKEELISRVDGALAVNIFQPQGVQLDPEAFPPVRFTELEMIRRAANRETVLPEAARVEGRWLINFVVSMPEDAEQAVMGVLMLTVATDPVETLLLKSGVSKGGLELQQQFGASAPLVIASQGASKLGNTESHDIQNTYWSLSFRPSHVMMTELSGSHVQAYVVIAISSILVVIFGFFAGRFIGGIAEQRMKDRRQGFADARVAAAGGGAGSGSVSQRADTLDVDLHEGDVDLLGLEDAAPQQTGQRQSMDEDILDIEDDPSVPDVVFRAYDIRGIAGEQITTHFARLFGQAIGSEAIDGGQESLVVGRDVRISSPELSEALIEGVLSTGCNVIDLGAVPTPLMYFATATLKESQSGVMVTASHNPRQYNGFKVVLNGKTRCDRDLKAIRARILRKDLYEGAGNKSTLDIVPSYIDTIFSDVALAGDVSIVIDAANGATGEIAPRLFEELGCHVTPLFCDPDGTFPNHDPDPSVLANLQPLIEKVKETRADLGVAFDGDGDRLVVVSGSGKIVWPDQLLMIFAKDIVSRNPGADVVFDVKSTRHLSGCITNSGGRPIMWKTGHAPMKNKMVDCGALLGGEYSGHIFIKDRWFGFDDGMYAAARLLEILTLQGQSLDEVCDEFPLSPSTPEIRIPVKDEDKFNIIERFAEASDFANARVIKIDGVRIEFSYGWGLVRASNTSPNLTVRCEADDEQALADIKEIISKELKRIDKKIKIKWNQ